MTIKFRIMPYKTDYHIFKIVKNLGFLSAYMLFSFSGFSQNGTYQSQTKSFLNVDPPSWWVGMSDQNLQILIHQQNIGSNTFSLEKNGDGVQLEDVELFPNSNYALLNLSISEKAVAQTFLIKSQGKAGVFTIPYTLNDRKSHKRGIDQKDIIYLITPDRFANGDSSNDSFTGMNETGIDRKEPYARHGGDIQGIIDHLGYINDLGMTAIWPNPLLENNQPLESYHGYAFTDYYKIDPRFGTNELYGALSDSLHQRNMKLIQDVVYNHIGNKHYLYRDIPDSSWFHFWDTYTKTNYRAPVLMDPHASDNDKKQMTDGWFDKHLPDLNQQNEVLAKYLVQQTLWWIEKYQIDALRIDTYAYCDQEFMRYWGKEVKEAFPDIFLFAETWVHGPTVQGYFQGDALAPEPNYLDGLTDFQTYYAINDALTKEQGWTEGINKLYYTLAADYIYPHTENLVTFLDNHDLARAFGYYKTDLRKMKIALTLLYTLRGIPSVYYGTEIRMKETDGHGKIREDFPGGWPTDTINKFLPEGRTAADNEIVKEMRQLASLRKNNPAIYEGTLTQYVPVKGLYVYFRKSGDDLIMVLINSSEETRTAPSSKFDEFLKGKKNFENLDGKSSAIGDSLDVPAMTSQIRFVKN